MPNWAIYDTVSNRVKKYLVSDPNDPTYPTGTNEGALKDPNVSSLLSIPVKYWKQSGGVLSEMTQGEKDAVDAELVAALLAFIHAGAKGTVDGTDSSAVVLRAFADIIKDEINALRQWITDFKADVAAATNLANLQTRVAANPDLPDRTLAQLRTAIKTRIDSGSVDS